MVASRVLLGAFVALTAFAAVARAATYTAQSTNGGQWDTPGTWTPGGGPPLAADSVIIPNGAVVNCSVTRTVASMQLATGARGALILGAGATLTVTNCLYVSAASVINGTGTLTSGDASVASCVGGATQTTWAGAAAPLTLYGFSSLYGTGLVLAYTGTSTNVLPAAAATVNVYGSVNLRTAAPLSAPVGKVAVQPDARAVITQLNAVPSQLSFLLARGTTLTLGSSSFANTWAGTITCYALANVTIIAAQTLTGTVVADYNTTLTLHATGGSPLTMWPQATIVPAYAGLPFYVTLLSTLNPTIALPTSVSGMVYTRLTLDGAAWTGSMMIPALAAAELSFVTPNLATGTIYLNGSILIGATYYTQSFAGNVIIGAGSTTNITGKGMSPQAIYVQPSPVYPELVPTTMYWKGSFGGGSSKLRIPMGANVSLYTYTTVNGFVFSFDVEIGYGAAGLNSLATGTVELNLLAVDGTDQYYQFSPSSTMTLVSGFGGKFFLNCWSLQAVGLYEWYNPVLVTPQGGYTLIVGGTPNTFLMTTSYNKFTVGSQAVVWNTAVNTFVRCAQISGGGTLTVSGSASHLFTGVYTSVDSSPSQITTFNCSSYTNCSGMIQSVFWTLTAQLAGVGHWTGPINVPYQMNIVFKQDFTAYTPITTSNGGGVAISGTGEYAGAIQCNIGSSGGQIAFNSPYASRATISVTHSGSGSPYMNMYGGLYPYTNPLSVSGTGCCSLGPLIIATGASASTVLTFPILIGPWNSGITFDGKGQYSGNVSITAAATASSFVALVLSTPAASQSPKKFDLLIYNSLTSLQCSSESNYHSGSVYVYGSTTVLIYIQQAYTQTLNFVLAGKNSNVNFPTGWAGAVPPITLAVADGGSGTFTFGALASSPISVAGALRLAASTSGVIYYGTLSIMGGSNSSLMLLPGTNTLGLSGLSGLLVVQSAGLQTNLTFPPGSLKFNTYDFTLSSYSNLTITTHSLQSFYVRPADRANVAIGGTYPFAGTLAPTGTVFGSILTFYSPQRNMLVYISPSDGIVTFAGPVSYTGNVDGGGSRGFLYAAVNTACNFTAGYFNYVLRGPANFTGAFVPSATGGTLTLNTYFTGIISPQATSHSLTLGGTVMFAGSVINTCTSGSGLAVQTASGVQSWTVYNYGTFSPQVTGGFSGNVYAMAGATQISVSTTYRTNAAANVYLSNAQTLAFTGQGWAGNVWLPSAGYASTTGGQFSISAGVNFQFQLPWGILYTDSFPQAGAIVTVPSTCNATIVHAGGSAGPTNVRTNVGSGGVSYLTIWPTTNTVGTVVLTGSATDTVLYLSIMSNTISSFSTLLPATIILAGAAPGATPLGSLVAGPGTTSTFDLGSTIGVGVIANGTTTVNINSAAALSGTVSTSSQGPTSTATFNLNCPGITGTLMIGSNAIVNGPGSLTGLVTMHPGASMFVNTLTVNVASPGASLSSGTAGGSLVLAGTPFGDTTTVIAVTSAYTLSHPYAFSPQRVTLSGGGSSIALAGTARFTCSSVIVSGSGLIGISATAATVPPVLAVSGSTSAVIQPRGVFDPASNFTFTSTSPQIDISLVGPYGFTTPVSIAGSSLTVIGAALCTAPFTVRAGTSSIRFATGASCSAPISMDAGSTVTLSSISAPAVNNTVVVLPTAAGSSVSIIYSTNTATGDIFIPAVAVNVAVSSSATTTARVVVTLAGSTGAGVPVITQQSSPLWRALEIEAGITWGAVTFSTTSTTGLNFTVGTGSSLTFQNSGSISGYFTCGGPTSTIILQRITLMSPLQLANPICNFTGPALGNSLQLGASATGNWFLPAMSWAGTVTSNSGSGGVLTIADGCVGGNIFSYFATLVIGAGRFGAVQTASSGVLSVSITGASISAFSQIYGTTVVLTNCVFAASVTVNGGAGTVTASGVVITAGTTTYNTGTLTVSGGQLQSPANMYAYGSVSSTLNGMTSDSGALIVFTQTVIINGGSHAATLNPNTNAAPVTVTGGAVITGPLSMACCGVQSLTLAGGASLASSVLVTAGGGLTLTLGGGILPFGVRFPATTNLVLGGSGALSQLYGGYINQFVSLTVLSSAQLLFVGGNTSLIVPTFTATAPFTLQRDAGVPFVSIVSPAVSIALNNGTFYPPPAGGPARFNGVSVTARNTLTVTTNGEGTSEMILAYGSYITIPASNPQAVRVRYLSGRSAQSIVRFDTGSGGGQTDGGLVYTNATLPFGGISWQNGVAPGPILLDVCVNASAAHTAWLQSGGSTGSITFNGQSCSNEPPAGIPTLLPNVPSSSALQIPGPSSTAIAAGSQPSSSAAAGGGGAISSSAAAGGGGGASTAVGGGGASTAVGGGGGLSSTAVGGGGGASTAVNGGGASTAVSPNAAGSSTAANGGGTVATSTGFGLPALAAGAQRIYLSFARSFGSIASPSAFYTAVLDELAAATGAARSRFTVAGVIAPVDVENSAQSARVTVSATVEGFQLVIDIAAAGSGSGASADSVAAQITASPPATAGGIPTSSQPVQRQCSDGSVQASCPAAGGGGGGGSSDGFIPGLSPLISLIVVIAGGVVIIGLAVGVFCCVRRRNANKVQVREPLELRPI